MRKSKQKREIRRNENKENKLGKYLLFHSISTTSTTIPTIFHLPLLSITIHIIWEYNYHKWYLLCF